MPQGGPRSPLPANIVLNELDHELEKRGHKFVRYADDMVIFCKSKADAEQALEHITPHIGKKLFLKVNREKTFAGYADRIKFPGFGFYELKRGNGWRPMVHEKSRMKLKAKFRELTAWHVNSLEAWKIRLWQFVRGSVNCFRLPDMGGWLRKMDQWMRRRIRMVFWEKWEHIITRYRSLCRLGLNHCDAITLATSRKGYWHNARTPNMNKTLSNKRLEAAGFPLFYNYYQSVIP